eukprot:7733005-Pyramimonas_sp.AAC.1
MVTDETEDVHNSTELDPSEAIHDSGATSVIVGHETLKGYCKQLVEQDEDIPAQQEFKVPRPVTRPHASWFHPSLAASSWRSSLT